VEGVVRILLEHYYKVRNSYVPDEIVLRTELCLLNELILLINKKAFIQQVFTEWFSCASCRYKNKKKDANAISEPYGTIDGDNM
jgi:hypothetical protein